MEVGMAEDIKWKSVDVLHAEGMTVRVGAFRSMDGTVAEFTPPIIQKMFEKLDKPIPIYYTHDGAGKPLVTRVPIGYAVKFGIDPMSHKLLYQAFLFDEESKKYIFADGCDCTSAEVDFKIDDLTKVPVDATLNGIAIVPVPAIQGTGMQVAAVAFSRKPNNQVKSQGGNTVTNFTSKTAAEKFLLEKGLTPDEVSGLFAGAQDRFARASNEAKLSADLEARTAEFADLETKYKDLETKFGEASKTIEAHLGEKITGLMNDIKTAGFATPEALVEGMPAPQAITILGAFKENLAKAPLDKKVDLSKTKDDKVDDAAKVFAEVSKELGVEDMIGKYMKPKGGTA
jgi:hypothetical protein